MTMLARSHAEAAANAIVGALLAQSIIWLFGLALSTAIALNASMIVASFGRSFVIRRLFARLP